MDSHWDTQIRVFLADAKQHRAFVVAMFSLISLALLAAGVMLPKVYESSTTVLVDDANIIRPLMEGTAVTTDVRERAAIAPEQIFSRKIIDQILKHGGWLESDPTAVEREEIVEGIKRRTDIRGGRDLITIAYRDSDPQRAFMVTGKFAELFIAESIYQKIKESQDALDFIDQQVEAYDVKLKEAEDALKEFRSANPDVRPGSEREVGLRIDTLQTSIDTTRLELRELEIQRDSFREKLAGEADLAVDYSRKQGIADRLTEMRTTLDTLRLSYTDAYPDIVSLKSQIADLEAQLADTDSSESANPGASAGPDLRTSLANPLYQDLRRDLSSTETQIETSQARILELEQLVANEREQARQVHEMEARLAVLTRDTEANEEMYRDLSLRRENARVSNNLDRQEQGLTFKIQEPAFLPLRPGGLRFLHFMISGLIVGFAAPLGLIYAKAMVDPRVRFEDVLTDNLSLPLLGSIPHYQSPRERRVALVNGFALGTVVVATLAVYAVVGTMRFQGAI